MLIKKNECTDKYYTSKIPTFSEHSESDCSICYGSSSKNVETKGEVTEKCIV